MNSTREFGFVLLCWSVLHQIKDKRTAHFSFASMKFVPDVIELCGGQAVLRNKEDLFDTFDKSGYDKSVDCNLFRRAIDPCKISYII